MRRTLAVHAGLTVVLGLFAPPAAADLGSIDDVADLPSGLVQATFTSMTTMCAGDCAWQPFAVQVPAAQPCTPDRAHTVYAGEARPGIGAADDTVAFTPAWSPARICLYVHRATSETLLAEEVHPAPLAAPAPVAVGQPVVSPRLTLRRARRELPAILASEFGAFDRRTLRRDCYRLLPATVRCRVAWERGRWRYRGAVDIRADPADPHRVGYVHTIRRERIGHRRPALRCNRDGPGDVIACEAPRVDRSWRASGTSPARPPSRRASAASASRSPGS